MIEFYGDDILDLQTEIVGVGSKTFYYEDPEHVRIFTKKWYPIGDIKPKAVIQVAQGMGEDVSFYEEFAREFVRRGYLVYTNDARGHGKTAGNVEDLSYKHEVGYAGIDGFNWMVQDLYILTEIIKLEYPDLPIYLLGNSLGSVLAQSYAYRYGKFIDGIIYCATTGPLDRERLQKLIDIGNEEVAHLGRKVPGLKSTDAFLGSWNQEFLPARTILDWLSRDEEMVDESLASPFSNIIFKSGFFQDLFNALGEIHKENNIVNIPKYLPIYSVSGDRDVFNDHGKGIKQLFKLYEQKGLKDITYKIYPEARHAILREINRKEVFEDIDHWLESHLSTKNLQFLL